MVVEKVEIHKFKQKISLDTNVTNTKINLHCIVDLE